MGHGRYDGIADDVDPMETVGFFISYTPLVLRSSESGTGPAAASLTDQIEPLMRRSLDFDLLRFMTGDARLREALHGLPRAGILFNHHGQLDEPDELPRSSRFRAAPGIDRIDAQPIRGSATTPSRSPPRSTTAACASTSSTAPTSTNAPRSWP